MWLRFGRGVLISGALALGLGATDFVPKGTKMGMVFQGPHLNRYDLSYGYSSTLALKVSRLEWDATPYSGPITSQGIQGSWVVRRSYLEDGIFNVYLMGGPFQVREHLSSQPSKLGFEGTLSADYETTQVYARMSHEWFESPLATQQMTTMQALYAPWESSYNQPTFWFGLQGQMERRHHTERSVAPMVRWVARRWWVDAGVHVSGESRGKLFLSVMHLF